jgi:hypothetical protein
VISSTAIVSEPLIRLSAFLGVFLAVALWETLAPRRRRAFARLRRWPHNLALVAIDTLLVRLLIPVTTFGAAVMAQA